MSWGGGITPAALAGETQALLAYFFALFLYLKIGSYSLSNLSGVSIIDTRRLDPVLVHKRTSLPIDRKPSSL